MTESIQTWEYLSTLRGVELHRLYRSPPSALAVFRKLLSPLAKQFVLSILYSPRPTPVKDIELFVNPSHTQARQLALEQLKRYHIIRESTTRLGRCISLVPDFARSLRSVLCGSNLNHAFGQPTTPPLADQVTIDDLDYYAREQWEGILGYMVGSTSLAELQDDTNGPPPQPSRGIISLLQEGHLISVHGTNSRGISASITKEGFAFVLRDINTQIWALLFLYVQSAEKNEMDKIEVLSFLFFLASLELGVAYSTSSLTEEQIQMLSDLSNIGIVYVPELEQENDDDDDREAALPPFFYPTRLATSLTSDSSSTLTTTSSTLGSSLQPSSASHTSPRRSSASSHSKSSAASSVGLGYLIIETNYRVYAYTSSPLQIALLSLFITLKSRHPNLVTGKLTKSSVQKAVRLGITADQIINFLSTNAHPSMRAEAAKRQAEANARAAAASTLLDNTTTTSSDTQNENAASTQPDPPTAPKIPIVDATIIDQIHLWQLERDRMTTDPGFLLKDFTSRAEFEDIARHADEVGVLVWRSDRRRMFFVRRIEAVQAFIRERREGVTSSATAAAAGV